MHAAVQCLRVAVRIQNLILITLLPAKDMRILSPSTPATTMTVLRAVCAC